MDSTRLPPFNVTRPAIERIEVLGGLVRIDVCAGGCCGRTYEFSTDAHADGDRAYGCVGAELVVSQVAADPLNGAKLDYSDRIKPPRFRILGNPNTPDRCPCNRSFGIKWPGRGQPGCCAKCPMPWDR